MTQQEVCHWHPERETRLHCGSCGRPICTECLRQHPVGIRCRECSREAPLPTHQVSTNYVLRGIGAAIGVGFVGIIALAFLLPAAGFLFFFLMLGLGYVTAEAIGMAVNRRRGRTYQYMALASVFISTVGLWGSVLGALTIGGLFDLGGVAVAALVAWHRLSP